MSFSRVKFVEKMHFLTFLQSCKNYKRHIEEFNTLRMSPPGPYKFIQCFLKMCSEKQKFSKKEVSHKGYSLKKNQFGRNF